MFPLVVKNGLLNLGKQALQSGVQVLDDIDGVEDVKVVVKGRGLEGAKKIGKKSISRASAKKTASHKQNVTECRLAVT